MNGVQTGLKCKPNVKRCKRFVFAAHSPLLHPNTLTTKAISHFQADHILTRFVFPPLNYYKEDMKGFQLGLVNANPDTRVQMMVYGGNATPANIGVRFKNQLFYTILGVGSMYQGLNDKFSASASYRAGLSFPLYKGLSISGDLGYQHIEAFDNKDEVIPKRLYALQARANLEYQFTRKFGIFATGGYGLTRFYNKSSNYDKGAIIEAGIVLF